MEIALDKPLAAIKTDIPEPTSSCLLPASLLSWRFLMRGIRCKQFALVGLLAIPAIAALSWQAEWQPIWLAPLGFLAGAAIVDFVGRVLVWISNIGDRQLIITSVVAQATGLLAAILFAVCVPSLGIQIGLVLAIILQVVAAMTFASFLKSVAISMGDKETAHAASRALSDIVSVLVSVAGIGGAMLIFVIILILIVALTCGFGLLYLPFAIIYLGGAILLVSTILFIYFVATMLISYAKVLARIQALINIPDNI